MAAQSFDTEVIGKIKPVQEIIESTMNKMVGAVDGSRELAAKNGIAALERDCSNAAEGTQAMVKAFTELNDCLDKYIKYTEKVSEALA